MESDAKSPYRELAYRASGGIEVGLFWHENTGELLVSVADEKGGAYLELAAGPHQALDVFNHPYAHAAFRGLAYEDASICLEEASSASG
jgi:hypothetical protein